MARKLDLITLDDQKNVFQHATNLFVSELPSTLAKAEIDLAN
jgi:hypothetical protein